MTISFTIETWMHPEGKMWHKLEFSSERIDSLKKEMQMLQDEAKRLLLEAKTLEQEDAQAAHDYNWLFQDGPRVEESGDRFISRICRTLHY